MSVIADKKGEGATTLSIGLAVYLSSVRGEKTAVIMTGDRESFLNLAYNYTDVILENNVIVHNISFYYAESEKEILNVCKKDYENVIVDMGCFYEKFPGVLMACKLKLILHSVNIWRCRDEKALPVCGDYENPSVGELYIVGGDKESVKSFLKNNNIVGVKKIQIDNPFIVEGSTLEFYQKII